MVFSTLLASLHLPGACSVLFSCHSSPFPSVPLLLAPRLLAHALLQRDRGGRRAGVSGLKCCLVSPHCFLLLLPPHRPLPLRFLSASLLTCMSSSVLLWLPRKKASPMLDSPLFLVSCDQQTAFGTPCFQNKDKVSVDLCRFLPITIYR